MWTIMRQSSILLYVSISYTYTCIYKNANLAHPVTFKKCKKETIGFLDC